MSVEGSVRGMPRHRVDTEYDAKRRQMLDVALSLFRTKGYEGTRLEDVADVLGVTKATIYYYFAKKSDLLIQICDQAIDESLKREQSILSTDEPADVRLRRAVADHITGMASNVALWDVFFRESELAAT